MKTSVFAALAVALLLVGRPDGVGRSSVPPDAPPIVVARPQPPPGPEELTLVVQRYCQVCHNEQMLTGNLSLQGFQVENAPARAEIAEKMIQKLRVGMMPPPGAPRPGADTLAALVETLESLLDRAGAQGPTPGHRSFQRLNRAEYTASVRELLDLEIDAGSYLPLDTKSANFDNIADVQMLSPLLMDAYMQAAAEISRLAVGDPNAAPRETQYRVSRWASQMEHVPGAPYGTRGGVAALHNFVADGDYVFRVAFSHETTGALMGNQRSALREEPELLEISIDGTRVALLEVDPWMHTSDPNGVELRTGPIFVTAGPHQVAGAFIRHLNGPLQDLVSPHEWSHASTAQANEYGTLQLPHLKDMGISGPFDPRGVSETPSRAKIFSCRPTSPAETRSCAEAIISRLASQAFRRPTVSSQEIEPLLSFYEEGAADGGFEVGIRTALEAMLSSPHFVFRFEEQPANARPGRPYRISDADLASRLSYFLWGTTPDAELMDAAAQGRLADRRILETQVRRMLADPRAEALGRRFAGQWLRLQDLEKINPDVRFYPDFHQQLRDAMYEETVRFFNHLVKEDRSIFEFFTADYTFVNERLAKHYGIGGVTGEEFRRVPYPDDRRKGIFGHGSVLTLTSVAGRTSPVLRGKWVMEVILGTPPPPPPPGVPDLEQTGDTQGGRTLTTRERMELHRASPTCNACHRFMDPIGLALDNFDVTGKWRIRENGAALDTRGQLYDGTPVQNPAQLQAALLTRPVPIVRNFAKNLMTYALGRRLEYYDMPVVRRITQDAEADGYRLSSFVLGIVTSDAFQMKNDVTTTNDSAGGL